MAPPTGNAQDGLDAAGVTPPAGADGIRGWLSGIYNRLGGTLTVALSSSSPLDVSDRSARLLGHVTVDNTITVGSDVTDRAGRLLGHVTVDNSVAVTGTFWQATQPVSGSVSVTGTVPVTGTFWQVTQPVSGSVSVSNFPATQPVSGTFWQATQPVSGTVAVSGTVPVSLATNTPDVTDRAGRLLGHVTVDSAPTTAVTGTFFQATQPVSLATNAPDVTDRAARALGVVTQQALTKGTQGANGVTTQDLKDAGRTAVVLSVTAVASIVSETAFTLNIWKAGTVTTSTSYTVTAGKTFRLQAVQFGCRFATPSTTVTFASARFNLRSGAVVGSPLVYGDSKLAAANAPVPNSDLPVPDGLEFPAATVLSLWHADSATTLLLDAVLVGYEY